jgi:hypothetical protein
MGGVTGLPGMILGMAALEQFGRIAAPASGFQPEGNQKSRKFLK